jgi:7-carboxy-7-deazaguanine synthase
LHRALAITGGEPLMQAEFLGALLPLLRAHGPRVLLETNGTRADALRALRGRVDIVSMDFKLRSATGRATPVAAHTRFLREAVRQGAEVYVKAVVSSATTPPEVARAARLIARASRNVPLVLQPATATGKRGPRPPGPDAMLRLQEAALKALPDVRVIPQTHKMTGQL